MVVVREEGLKAELGLFDVINLIMGSMIGSGIFILPAAMAARTGSASHVVVAWIVGAILTICGALTFAELASRYPKQGGQYVFLRETMGARTAFLYGWSMFWVIQTAIIAAVAVAFATFLGFFVDFPGTTLGVGFLTIPPWGLSFTAVALIWFLTAVNWFGVKRGALVQNVSTVLKVAALLFIVVAAFLFGDRRGDFSDVLPAGAALGAFGLALTASLFAFDGWPQATYVMGEVKDPQRTVPRALLIAVLGVASVYILASAAYFWVLPLEEARASTRIAADVTQAVFGTWGGAFVAAAVMVSTFGTVNAYILTSPRIFYALARDRAFPDAFGKLHTEHRTPTYGLWYQAVWASLLALSGTYVELVLIVVFGLWFFYVPTGIGYFRSRRWEARGGRSVPAAGFRTPWYPVVPIVFILSALYIIGNTLREDPRTFLVGLGLIATGVPVLLFREWRAKVEGRRQKADAPASGGK
ncbi:MAG: APC family permease [Methanobacteriota archaeon]